jgi:hypothetical protein
MTLKAYTESLSKDKQIRLAIKLIKLAIPIWDNYADKHELIYRDTVVGLIHSVNRELLKDAIEAIEKDINLNKLKRIFIKNIVLIDIHNQFDDPIVALQDIDWELPDEVLKIFYAVYNLLDSFIEKNKTFFDESKIYVSIDQALDAL